jgi:type I restriction-modification system DNA methylase subunit
MPLSWNEIKSRAIEFSKEWENDFNEHAEAKSFMDAFFNVFGIPRRRVAAFEANVKKEDGKQGFIDLLWKGNILIEFKSRGKNLDKAHTQAKDYFPGIKDGDLPKFILVCDFANFRLYDLEENSTIEFKLSELVHNVQHFGYLLGYQRKVYKEQDPANIKAAELMGKLHDRLEEIGYIGHPLEVYLVRILFCLFAEDTTIFNKQQFQDFIEQRTNEDGSDLAAKLQELFQVLNTDKQTRFTNLDEQLAEFPYVNGKLFKESLPTASFDSKMRQALLDCCYLDWSKISPAIFGSMFQSVMNPKERRNLGAHYTSETNILKLIKPLFLDDLWKEFESIKDSKPKLNDFHKKLSTLKFLDPACGCGNFLVITYRELRLLEIEILRTLKKKREAFLNIGDIIWLEVDMMYGIEYEEFPARIAEVAMWLIDHQMNQLISNEFGQYYVRLPLKKSATIVHGNALQIDWETVVAKDELSYILGNPPFVGKKEQSKEQKAEMMTLFAGVRGAGVLDYVSAWYLKAAQFIQNTTIKVAFVATNSISQGEQVGILWSELLGRYNISIHFAHRTFKWTNEARGKAAVFCIIIGFAAVEAKEKSIFEYDNVRGDARELKVQNINPYLVNAKNILLQKRTSPICNVPRMVEGITPLDNGLLSFSNEEYLDFMSKEPAATKWFKPWITGHSFINNYRQYCLWMTNIKPEEIRALPLVFEKVKAVKSFREKSKSSQEFASTPWLFRETTIADTYVLVPKTSSESRNYIPMGFVTDGITSSSALMVNGATTFHLGVLMSLMNVTWVKNIGGRLKSDFRYSKDIVYNNFPWPENPTEKQVKAIETAAQRVLDARLEFPNSSLADLYDPLTMPPSLVKAHNELDKAVDLAYRPQAFTSEANRMVFLFELYEKYTANLFTKAKPKRTKKKKDE